MKAGLNLGSVEGGGDKGTAREVDEDGNFLSGEEEESESENEMSSTGRRAEEERRNEQLKKEMQANLMKEVMLDEDRAVVYFRPDEIKALQERQAQNRWSDIEDLRDAMHREQTRSLSQSASCPYRS